MGRSAVMAESLAGYTDIVKERIATVKKTIESLQKPAYYKETFEAFETPVMEDVPSDVAENWIDELTIRQFNEELSDVFPYIYNLVKEGTKAVELGPDDLAEVAGPDKCWPGHRKVGTQPGTGKNKGKRVNKCKKIEGTEEDIDESGLQYHTGVKKHGKEYMVKAAQAGREGASQEELGRLKDKYSNAEKNKKTKEEIQLEQGFEEMMGQFSEERTDEFLPALAIPALITAARVAAPKLIQMGAKILTKGAQGAGAVAKGAGKVAAKNPGTTAAVGGGAYVGKKAGDAIDAVGDMAGDLATSASDLIAKAEGGVEAIQGEISAFLGGDAVKQVAAMASKYALPALAVVALLYGGKKVIDMLKSKGDDNMQTASMEEDDLEEAYINTSKDAIEVLGALRGMGKKIERGQDDDQGNLANAYVGDVWDVYSFIEARTNGFSGLDKNAKDAIDAMMKLRGEAKKLETKPGSGKNARFGNAIVTVLYPVIEYLYTTDFDRNKKEDDTDEGNAYSGAVAQAKKDGKKKGDKIKGPDGDEITLEKDQKTPLGEFILSYFDREAGQFPKGETAVLTMVEKDYGEQFIEPAKAFIEKINNKVAEMYGYKEAEQDTEYLRMRELAGL
jgi:hypothetical protein